MMIDDDAHSGLSKIANEEHARDLPMMNGIKEDIKAICVMDAGSPAFQEALFNLSSRLKSLLVTTALFNNRLICNFHVPMDILLCLLVMSK